jgi:hypothetical protein
LRLRQETRAAQKAMLPIVRSTGRFPALDPPLSTTPRPPSAACGTASRNRRAGSGR